MLLNAGGVASVVAVFLKEPPDPKPAERVTYLDLVDPRPEKKRDEPEPKPREDAKERELRPLEPEKELEFEELEEPEPEELPPEEPPPEEPAPEEPQPKPEDFFLDQMKMVEQPDEVDEQDAPTDADYLSNVNRSVREQTRAKITNLVEDAREQKARQMEPSPAPEVGTAAESKIAEQQQQRSKLARKAPDVTPEPKEQRAEQRDPKPQTLLSMRDLEKREHKMAQEAHEPETNEVADGELRPSQKEEASIAPQDQQARLQRNDRRHRFRVAQKDLDAVFGREIDAQRNIISQRQSKQKGVWEEARERWQSPLENMIPEVKVGNQTALNSRRHPFARYIATMHRTIHDLWAWGFLDQLDTRSRRHPMNDYSLWSRVEMVLRGDGTIERVITVRHSGNTAFDAAAREIVWAAGPFPNPPREIRSGNGKIYIHWAFHRDARACGTFGAQPFILDNAGYGDRPDPNIEVRPGSGGRQARRLSRGRSTAPTGPMGPAPPPGYKPRGGSGHHGHTHAPRPAPGARVPVQRPGAAPPVPPAPPETDEERAADPEAKKTADAWLHYLATGDIDRLVAKSSIPFHAGDIPVARTKVELRDVLRALSEESREAGRPKAAKVHTAAELRRLFRSVPAGVQEGSGRVYGLTKIGKDLVILMLDKRFGSWRVAGIAR